VVPVALKVEPAEKKSPWAVSTEAQRAVLFKQQKALLARKLLNKPPRVVPIALKVEPAEKKSPWAVTTPEQREAAFQEQKTLLARALVNKPPRVVPIALKVRPAKKNSPWATTTPAQREAEYCQHEALLAQQLLPKKIKIEKALALKQALEQPKSAEEEAALAAKYAPLDVDERCFQILMDLGMFTDLDE